MTYTEIRDELLQDSIFCYKFDTNTNNRLRNSTKTISWPPIKHFFIVGPSTKQLRYLIDVIVSGTLHPNTYLLQNKFRPYSDNSDKFKWHKIPVCKETASDTDLEGSEVIYYNGRNQPRSVTIVSVESDSVKVDDTTLGEEGNFRLYPLMSENCPWKKDNEDDREGLFLKSSLRCSNVSDPTKHPVVEIALKVITGTAFDEISMGEADLYQKHTFSNIFGALMSTRFDNTTCSKYVEVNDKGDKQIKSTVVTFSDIRKLDSVIPLSVLAYLCDASLKRPTAYENYVVQVPVRKLPSFDSVKFLTSGLQSSLFNDDTSCTVSKLRTDLLQQCGEYATFGFFGSKLQLQYGASLPIVSIIRNFVPVQEFLNMLKNYRTQAMEALKEIYLCVVQAKDKVVMMTVNLLTSFKNITNFEEVDEELGDYEKDKSFWKDPKGYLKKHIPKRFSKLLNGDLSKLETAAVGGAGLYALREQPLTVSFLLAAVLFRKTIKDVLTRLVESEWFRFLFPMAVLAVLWLAECREPNQVYALKNAVGKLIDSVSALFLSYMPEAISEFLIPFMRFFFLSLRLRLDAAMGRLQFIMSTTTSFCRYVYSEKTDDSEERLKKYTDELERLEQELENNQ